MKRIKQLMFTLLMLLVPMAAAAEDYVGKAYNYSVQLEGTSQISLKLPVYDQSGSDSWVVTGNVYYTVNGGSGAKAEGWYYRRLPQQRECDGHWQHHPFPAMSGGTSSSSAFVLVGVK